MKFLAVLYWYNNAKVEVCLGSGVRMKVGMLWLVKKSKSSMSEWMTESAVPDAIVNPGWSMSLSPHVMTMASNCGKVRGMFV